MSSSIKLIAAAMFITVIVAGGGVAGAIRSSRDRLGTPMAMAIDAPRIASTFAVPLSDSPVTPDAERDGWITHCESLLAPTLQGQEVRPLCDCLFDELAAKLGTNGAMEFGPQVLLNPGAATKDIAAAASDAMEGCKAKLGL